MKNLLVMSVRFVLCFFACSLGGNIVAQQLPALDFLDRKVASWINEGFYDGAAVRIVRNSSLFFEKDYGGFTDTTALHVASAGKWITAATIAALVDEGKLSWNDKVSKYLPEFTGTKGRATLRQLLSHTAGYPDYQPEGKRRDDYQTLKEAVENILSLPADTLPGTKFRYGGLTMQVAGRMAEIATGKDWETLFQEKIGRSLKMERSHFVPVSEEPGFSPMLAGGFKTCVKDYMNFLNMFLHNGKFKGKQILSKKSVREIEADQVGSAQLRQPEYVANSRQNYHNGVYGLGCWLEELDNNGHATLISSPGWAGAYPWIDRKNNTYGFILAKVNEEKADRKGFSSFYSSPVLPLVVRDAIRQTAYPKGAKKRMIDIGGAKLYYEELGSGEPVIFVHGHSLDHDMWNRQFFEFAKKYRAIRYDLRGYGYSSPQTETEQFTHVDDLIKLMDALKIQKAHIVGLSLGGYIGTDMLGLYPGRILSMTLASGNIRHLPKPSIPMSKEEARTRDGEIARLKKNGRETMRRAWFNGLMNSGGSRREQMRYPLWSMVYQWDMWQPLHKEVRVTAGDDAFNKLKASRPMIPVLILEGKSANNHFPQNPEILKYLPNARFEIIQDAGHMMNMEQPRAFNKVIFEFYNKLK